MWPKINSKAPLQCGTAPVPEEYAMFEFLQETVQNNMSRNVRSVSPETTVGDLYRLFAADDFDAYPVIRGDVLVGMVSKLDALKIFCLSQDRILPRYAEGIATKVDEIMTSEVIAVDGETNLQRVLELMVKHRVKSLPVVDHWHNLIGIIAREDIMRAMERTVLQHYPPVVPFQAV
jgi:predicted transcriptional regulator